MNKDQELQVLNNQAQIIAQQLDRIESSLMEIEYLKNSIGEIGKVKEGTEILAPLSNGIFIKAKLDMNDKLLINVGNNVVVEKTSQQANKLLDERVSEMNEAKEKLLDQMQKIEERLLKFEEE